MDFNFLWTAGFILLAAGIVALFARVVLRSVKGKSCQCCSSCFQCRMCSKGKVKDAKSDDEKKD